MDYEAFVKGRKTMLVAPAGYGKTYTIMECLKYTYGRQLILTHTHAGVASIKEKIKHQTASCSIETISSFAQKYCLAFYTGKDMPDQDAKEYHSFIIAKAKEIFASPMVKKVIAATYTGLFVDEYQDCTKEQHHMISVLSEVLPTHILGDPMQGIFDFNGDAVNFESDLSEFEKFPELSIPHRWYQEGNSSELGDILKGYRDNIKHQQPISLVSNPQVGLHVVTVKSDDFRNPQSMYRKGLHRLIQNPKNNPEYDSLLLIVPEYQEIKSGDVSVPKGDIKHRAQIRAQIDFSRSLILLEAIDDKTFYSISKKADELIHGICRAKNRLIKIRELLDVVFNKTDLDDWFNEIGLKTKKSESDKNKSINLQEKINAFIANPSPENIHKIVMEAKSGLRLKYKRDEVLYGFMRALKEAEQSKITVYEAMKKGRNLIRRSGRKVHGKCIGTTLLTKGLEFDTVAILDAHRFNCPKNLYVALTRCCKNLIIFTEKIVLLEKLL